MREEYKIMLEEMMELEERLDHLNITKKKRREFELEIEELERLAEIGRATERFFDEDAETTFMAIESNCEGKVIALGLDELVGWYLEKKEGND